MNSSPENPVNGRHLGRRNFLKLLLSAGMGAIFSRVRGYAPTAAEADPNLGVRAADLRISGQAFSSGTLQNAIIGGQGLTIQGGTAGSYTSPVLDAPLPFNAIVPQWTADLPETVKMTLRLRTASPEGAWSNWFTIPQSDDWTRPEDEDVVGNMLTVPDEHGTHALIQYEVELDGTDDVPATLREMRFTCIDATAGPQTSELLARQAALPSEQGFLSIGYPKPPVVSRAAWCTSSACNYTSGLRYEPVTHLIVHHTVTNNGSSNWAAIVRAIWYFHTFTRGWGDIGYNYLVDMDGVLYEGHLGGDDVVGTHAADANAGSMALALIGTFTEANASIPGIRPPAIMLNAAADLLAWKADQKGIDVYGASHLPYVRWGLPHLMGHRDVYGTTSCPGEQAFDLLPWLRDEVAQRIGFSSPYIYVDDLSSAFTKSDANWHDSPDDAGFAGHSYLTFSTTDPALSVNWGEWQLPIPQDGWYQVAVYAPFANTGKSETRGARYRVTHANGEDLIVVDQEENLGVWASLGDFYFQAGMGGKVFLSDLTTTDDDKDVWFDAIRLLPYDDLPLMSMVTEVPAARDWQRFTAVEFRWSLNNPVVVSELTLDVARDEAFNDLILSISLANNATTYVHDFSQDHAELYWRLRARTLQNQITHTEPVRFGIDTTAPISSANRVLYDDLNKFYVVVPEGTDAASGIASYNIDVRADGESTWSNLAPTVPFGAGLAFTPPDPGRIYWFRSQATDVAGNVEAVHSGSDASTAGALLLDDHFMLPIVRNKK